MLDDAPESRSPLGLVPFPFALPGTLLPELGDGCDRLVVGLYWAFASAQLVYNDGLREVMGANGGPFLAFLRRPPVRHWLYEFEVDLGCSAAPAAHWLLVYRPTNSGFVAPARLAERQVRRQVLDFTEGGEW